MALIPISAAVLSLAAGVSPLGAVATAAGGSGPPQSSSTPAVSGTARDGARLKVSKGSWTGETPRTFTYRWQRCDAAGEECANLAEATKPSYKAASADVGHRLRAIVTAANAAGSASATSKASALVGQLAPKKLKAPGVSGLAEDGRLVSAGTGTWKGTPPLSFSYQWESCAKKACTPIPGATESSYRAQTAQLGRQLRAIVTAANGAGSASATSKPTNKVVPGPPLSIEAPAVSGTPLPGQTLTATTGSWGGTAPLAFAYQWQSCNLVGECSDIAGATGSTYAVAPLDVASSLRVLVTATNSLGAASATSDQTGLVKALLPENLALPSIGGILQDGQLLSAVLGSWSGTEPISYAYQWQVCNSAGEGCKDIAEAVGSTLSLSPALVGSTVRLVVTATNAAGSTSATSAASSPILAILPKNTALPSISGILEDGKLLSAVTGSWSGTEPISYAYQWQVCNSAGEGCKDIAEAIGSTLTLSPNLVGSTVRAIVTATNARGSTSAASAASSPILAILPANTALPTISGVLKNGQLLSASSGSWSGTAPMSFGYQWQLCNALGTIGSCADVSKATSSTFLLGLLDVGLTLRVGVTASNARGSSAPAYSSVTGLIAGLLLTPASGPSSGGTTVNIAGSGVNAATAVHFGSAEASEVEVKSPTEITAQAPAGSGTVPVTVSVPEGTTAANPSDQFTYR